MQAGRIVEEQLAGGVLQWTLAHRARKNALTPEMLAWIRTRCPELRGETVILRGEDPDYFCAGFDLRHLEPEGKELPDAPLIAATRAMNQAAACFIAHVHGPAIGGGVELAVSCDLMIASENSYFQVPAGRLGIIYHAAGIDRLRAVLGQACATRLLLTGEPLAVSDAQLRPSLIDVLPRADLDEAVRRIALATRANLGEALTGNRLYLRSTNEESGHDAIARAHDVARKRAYSSELHRQALGVAMPARRPSRG